MAGAGRLGKAPWMKGRWERYMPAMLSLSPRIAPIVMLIFSNVFMTFAWYGHLRFKDRALWLVVLASWGIALFEYCLAVPANRIGSAVYSGSELKAMQEVITLTVFAVFSVAYLGERVTLNHLAGFALIALGAFVVFKGPFA
jgi:uncharacterized protein (DUF486 family)